MPMKRAPYSDTLVKMNRATLTSKAALCLHINQLLPGQKKGGHSILGQFFLSSFVRTSILKVSLNCLDFYICNPGKGERCI